MRTLATIVLCWMIVLFVLGLGCGDRPSIERPYPTAPEPELEPEPIYQGFYTYEGDTYYIAMYEDDRFEMQLLKGPTFSRIRTKLTTGLDTGEENDAETYQPAP